MPCKRWRGGIRHGLLICKGNRGQLGKVSHGGPSRLRLPQKQVHDETPPYMRPLPPAVNQDLGVGAACFFQGVGEDGHGAQVRHRLQGPPAQELHRSAGPRLALLVQEHLAQAHEVMCPIRCGSFAEITTRMRGRDGLAVGQPGDCLSSGRPGADFRRARFSTRVEKSIGSPSSRPTPTTAGRASPLPLPTRQKAFIASPRRAAGHVPDHVTEAVTERASARRTNGT